MEFKGNKVGNRAIQAKRRTLGLIHRTVNIALQPSHMLGFNDA